MATKTDIDSSEIRVSGDSVEYTIYGASQDQPEKHELTKNSPWMKYIHDRVSRDTIRLFSLMFLTWGIPLIYMAFRAVIWHPVGFPIPLGILDGMVILGGYVAGTLYILLIGD